MPELDPDWEYKNVPDLLGGVNGYRRPDQLEDNQAVGLLNVIAKQGQVIADTGYKYFAREPIYVAPEVSGTADVSQFQPTLFGTPQGEFSFVQNDQTVETLMITTRTMYKYDAGNNRWHLVKGTAETTVTSITRQSNLGNIITVINVASTAGFSSGDIVGVATADGDEFHCECTVSGGTALVLNTPFLFTKFININPGARVVRGVRLAGELNYQISSTNYPGSDWFVFTNGVDIVKRYDGSDCIDVPNLPSSGNTICRAVGVFNAALFLFNTTEGGVRHPCRARRSNQGDPTDWTTGTAGTDDLLDQPWEILCGHLLGSYLYLYRAGCISRGQFVGSGGLNYYFEDMVPGEGALSTCSVIVTEDFHVVVGNNNVYKYKGGYNLEPIGDQIFHAVFSKNGNLHPQYKNRTIGVYVPETEEIWIGYVSLDGTSADTVLRWNITYGIWYTRKFYNEFVNFALYNHLNVFSWDDLQGSWDQQKWTWDSSVQVQEAQAVHMLASAEAQVYEYDYNSSLDNAQPITYSVESKEFLAPDVECTFDQLDMMIEAVDALVEYSTDEGRTWDYLGETRAKALVNNEHKGKVSLFKQFPFQRVRFRWSGTAPAFKLDWFAFYFKKTSQW